MWYNNNSNLDIGGFMKYIAMFFVPLCVGIITPLIFEIVKKEILKKILEKMKNKKSQLKKKSLNLN